MYGHYLHVDKNIDSTEWILQIYVYELMHVKDMYCVWRLGSRNYLFKRCAQKTTLKVTTFFH